jgi:hypothetical protein
MLSRLAVAKHSAGEISDPVERLGERIAAMALREASFFDRLLAVRVPTSCTPMARRRHKQFVSEIASYYCCVCDRYFESRESVFAESFMDAVVERAAEHSSQDSFFQPLLYIGDLVDRRITRYQRAITERRNLFKTSTLFDESFLASIIAEALARLVSDDETENLEVETLQLIISQRLEWTSRELTG